ncbi:MAG: putative rane-bound dehydrogenase [Phycisphaerales bacterium]|nr:putative rane-bound dehydrogenase [Phycisphaerales bacterium]
MKDNSRATLAVFFLCIGLLVVLSSVAPAAQVQVNGRTFTVPDGFTVELVAGPPLVDRPIIADFDERGRLYVADSSGSTAKVEKQLAERPHRIVRLEDVDGDGRFERQTVFADHMMFPEGAMWFAGSLYVSAPPSIWKLTDTLGKGVVDQRSEWFEGKTLTGCANDLHGPYLGPDGWIYWCKGAFAKQTYERAGRKPFVTRAAHIFRCRPDGSGIEPVMTGGMDNPVEVVFTAGGERIFTTTFLQQPAAGRRDGLIHAIYGGVYGKVHDVIDDHPRTGPEMMPVLAHLGPAAPCGLARYESGAFGEEYRDNLFSTSFNLHKVFRHVLKPEGATFVSKEEDFMTCDSLDFHPTHVMEDADGSLLVIDTGGWYKLCCPTSQIGKPDVLGAIYRVRRTGALAMEDPRGLRLAWENLTAAKLADLLGDARWAVRRRAIQALATKGAGAVAAIAGTLKESKSETARLNGVWAACRIDDARARGAVRGALADRDETVRQAAIHAVSVWRDRAAVEKLTGLLSGASLHNRRAAAEALGRMGDAAAVPALSAALERPVDRALEHSLIYAMIEIGDAKGTGAGLASGSPAVRRAALVALDQMEAGGLKAEAVVADLSAADARLREAAAWIAGRHPEWGDALAETLGRRLADRGLSEGDRAELQHQLAKLAKGAAIQELLAARLSNATASVAERRLVMAAMAEAGPRDLPAVWLVSLSNALADKDPELAAASATTFRKLALRKESAAQIAPALLRLAARADVPETARIEALAAIPGGAISLDADVFAFLKSQLASDRPAVLRLAAADVIGRAKLTDAQLLEATALVKDAGPLEIDRLLAAFGQSGDAVVGLKLVDALGAAKSLTSLRPESLKPRLKKFGPEVQRRAEEIYARLSPDAGGQKARLDQLAASLPAGDVRRGQAVFNNVKVACVSCHAIGYLGGKVGPDLTRIGAIRGERDLLESILYPSASFVQSFEPVIVETADGDVHSGIMRKNDAEELVLVAGPEQEIRIARKDVKAMRPGAVSVMPAGLDQQLSPQEMADLVAFLRACK